MLICLSLGKFAFVFSLGFAERSGLFKCELSRFPSQNPIIFTTISDILFSKGSFAHAHLYLTECSKSSHATDKAIKRYQLSSNHSPTTNQRTKCPTEYQLNIIS